MNYLVKFLTKNKSQKDLSNNYYAMKYLQFSLMPTRGLKEYR